MSLVFAALTPHPPIAIPEIGKDNLAQINATIKALKNLNQELLKIKPDTILIISPHGPIYADAFSINLATKYQGEFHQFGDFVNSLEFKGDLELIYEIKNSLEKKSDKFPLVLTSQANLDHGALVPLYYLAKGLKNLSITPLGYSFLDYQTHFDFGCELKHVIDSSSKKIAVIASGDLSHGLTPDAPAPWSPAGKTFDDKLIKLLKKNEVQKIINFDLDLVEQASECGLRSILILLGILNASKYQTQILSYEGPFGVGYLTANFKLG